MHALLSLSMQMNQAENQKENDRKKITIELTKIAEIPELVNNTTKYEKLFLGGEGTMERKRDKDLGKPMTTNKGMMAGDG